MIEIEDLVEMPVNAFDDENTKLYRSKFEILSGDSDFQNVILSTNRGAWKNVDWDHEPSKELSEYFFIRCQQLRDKYDYLVLYFSGGADSETMLQSFIKAKIPVDEIVFTNFNISGNNPCKQLVLAEKTLKIYSQRYLGDKTKINKVTLNDKNFQYFLNNVDWANSSWAGTISNFTKMPTTIYKKLNFKVDARESGKVGHIFGESKPHIIKREGKYFALWDVPLSTSQWATEWFYTSLDLPELHVKQCHIIKNWFQKNQPDVELIYEKSGSRKQLNSLIRNPFNDRYQTPKSMGLLRDIKGNGASEDSLYNKELEEYAPELYDRYVNEVVKTIIFSANVQFVDPMSGDLKRLKTESFLLDS